MSAAFPYVLRKPPAPSAFYAPSDLSSASLIHQIITVAGDLLTTYSNRRRGQLHQHQNARSLLRRIQVLLTLFEFLLESERPLPHLAKLCLHEFYIIIHRARFLLDYFFHSSRLWLLLHNQMISCHFHELEHEISILLDVLPLNELCLSADVLEHVELVRRQVKNSRFCIDVRVEELRVKILSFLSEFEEQRLPDLAELKITFLDRIGILEAGDFDSEIEFLEEQIYNSHESEAEADSATIAGVIAVARYAKLLLFGIHEAGKDKRKQGTKPAVNCISIPNDFCCPISLELMSDPVVVSTGQTYDRNSIAQWIAAGHKNCPNSGQTLVNSELIPNQPMRILISQWCAFNSVPCSGHGISSREAAAAASKATMEATRAISRILIQYLSNGDFDSKKAAAGELRLLAKIGKLNRVIIAEEGAIPLLSLLLNSGSPIAQGNAVGALLNLSIHDANKRKIIIQEGCLASIVTVLRSGLTPESRENAAAALFSLSALHEYKKLIVDEPGGAEALGWLLKYGSTAGKKDAVRALFNLSMHPESWERMVNSSAVGALVGALEDEKVAEAAAGALALLARRPTVAGLVGWEEKAIMGLVGVMRAGGSLGRKNAAAALTEICRRGGAVVTEIVAGVLEMSGVVQTISLNGTKRARRKAAALAWILRWGGEIAPPPMRTLVAGVLHKI